MSFADNLRAAMDRAGVSQSELARRLNIRSQAVNQWLKPGGTAPRGARLHTVASALNVALSELLAEPAGSHPNAAAGSGYGQRIAAFRTEQGKTEAEFAANLGVPVELLLLWEAEELPLDQGALTKLWQVGISADWLLFGDERGRGLPIKPQSPPRRTAACVIPVARMRGSVESERQHDVTDLYDNLIGIPWYRPERYGEARARMADAERLPPTYDLWRERAEQREHQVRREGHTPSRVYVDDDQFVAFCAERGQILDSKARSQFALSKAVGHWKANVTNYFDPVFPDRPMRWK